MRTLNRNKTKWYYVKPASAVDDVDVDNNYTGDQTITFTAPVEIYMDILPRNGDIIEQVFGRDDSVNAIGVSDDIILTKDALLFEVSPVAGTEITTYVYAVTAIIKTLNSYTYGFKERV